MTDIAWFDSPDFGLHATPPGHPERQARWHAIHRALAPLRPYLQYTEAPLIEPAALERIYGTAYISILEDICHHSDCPQQYEALGQPGIMAKTPLDADTFVSPRSWQAAQRAAGACVAAVRAVMAGQIQQAFCGVRPPGHHATSSHAMGFCLLNNIALAAEEALQCGARRVAILDWDVHHGNGTQDIFWRRPDVYYASIHQHLLYPGTGAAHERGADAGQGATLNCPLPAGSTDAALLAAWTQHIAPALTSYKPDILLISAGFDADRRDPLSDLQVTAQGLGTLSKMVLRWAQRVCAGRVVSTLEGGYNLESLAENTAQHVQHMLQSDQAHLS